jgi:filamentous hemagglutinin family protein
MARRRGYVRLVGLLSMTLLWPLAGAAQVATDGTLGAKVRLTGRDVKVPARLGQVRGQNLFHSFERFGIETGGKVTFTGPAGLKNVIGRVTGGAPSKIDGTLASQVRGADLWLLNPAGILFGPHARLDVPGSFHASTADELRFEDGKVFSALDPSGRVLSVAPPAAFGFLGAKPPGPITVDRSVLDVPEGETLSLIGGDITLRGSNDGIVNDDTFGFTDEPGTVRAEAGRVSLAALGGRGTADVVTDRASGAISGTIRLSGEASVISSGNGGGAIHIRGGRLVVEDRTSVFADNLGASPAAGGIAIEAGTIEIRGGGAIRSSARGRGNAGKVMVTAADHLGIDAAGVATGTTTGIASRAIPGSTGDTGRVAIKAHTIDIRGGGVIRSATQGQGNASEVMVAATGHLTIDGAGVSTGIAPGITSRADDGRTGHAGRVTVTAGTIDIRRGGVIRSSTLGPGNAGAVTVTTAGHLAIDAAGIPTRIATGIASWAEDTSTGDTGRVAVKAHTIDIRGGGRGASGAISSSTRGEGNAGGVAVEAHTIEIRNGGLISSTTRGGGDGGKVAVTAGHLGIDAAGSKDFTGIASRATETSTGAAGRVEVTADTIEIRSRGDGGLSSSTFGPGPAGRVAVTAGRLTVADGGRVETDSERAGGAAGDVSVQARHLAVRDGALIGSSGRGTGPAGDVRVAAGTLLVEDASVRTEGRTNKGGAIAIIASDWIELWEAEVTSNGLVPEPGKSVITLQAPLIVVDTSRVTSLTTGQPLGGSGLVRLLGGTTVISADSVVAASSDVTVTGAEGDVGSRLVVPESVFLNVDDLLRESCAARRSGTASSFTAMGQGGLPPGPAGPLAGAYRELGGTTVAGQTGPVLAASFGEGCKAAPGS